MKLLKFGAEWCGPCKTMDQRLAGFTDCDVVKYNIESEDEETESLIEKYNIRNIPVIILLDDEGNVVNRWTGLVQASEISDYMK